MDGIHDMGGMHGFGPVVTAEGEWTHHEPWEVRAQVLTLLADGLSMRPAIEGLDPATYLSSSYYERWLRAGERGLTAQGRLSTDDLVRWRARFESDPAAVPPVREDPALLAVVARLRPVRFDPATGARHSVGDRVRVLRMHPPEHHRCPRYLRGATGVVERVIGNDMVPGPRSDERETVYTVEFDAVDLFGDGEPADGRHTVLVDLFERYLEAA